MAGRMEIGSLAGDRSIAALTHHGRSRPDAPAVCLRDERLHVRRRSTERSSQVGRRARRRRCRDRATASPTSGKNSLRVLRAACSAPARSGRVIVPVNWRLAPTEIAQIVDDSTAVVAGRRPTTRSSPPIASVRRPARRDPRRGHWWRRRGAAARRVRRLRRVGRRRADRRPGSRPGPDDVALQLYTSGTTGSAQGSDAHATATSGACCPPTARDWGFGPTSVNLVTLPNFHVGGVGWALVGLFVGAASVVLPEFDAAAVLGRSPTHGVTHVVFVPGGARRPAGRAERRRHRRRLARARSSTAPRRSPRPCWPRRCDRFGCRFIQGYGLTETVGARDPAARRTTTTPVAPSPIGCARPAGRWSGVEVRVVDPTTGADAAGRHGRRDAGCARRG